MNECYSLTYYFRKTDSNHSLTVAVTGNNVHAVKNHLLFGVSKFLYEVAVLIGLSSLIGSAIIGNGWSMFTQYHLWN